MGILSELAQLPKVYNLGEPLRGYLQTQAASGIRSLGIVPFVFPVFVMNPAPYSFNLYPTKTLSAWQQTTVPHATVTELLDLRDRGIITRISIHMPRGDLGTYIEIDGVNLDGTPAPAKYPFVAASVISPKNANARQIDMNTPGIQTDYTADGSAGAIYITTEIPFETQLRLQAFHTSGANRVYNVGVMYKQ